METKIGSEVTGAIADTARWTALLRARESVRSDFLFRDPFAKALSAGVEDSYVAKRGDSLAWPIVLRTHLIDRLIAAAVAGKVDLIVHLAAGLDTRPYRMDLERSLRWVEVDLPQVIAEKAEILKDAAPKCRLERFGIDLTDAAARRTLLHELAADANHALVVTEGFLVYLTPEEVAAIADDLAGHDAFRCWIADLQLPGLIRALGKMGPGITPHGVSLKFSPADIPGFFAGHGWPLRERHSILEAAIKADRAPEAYRAKRGEATAAGSSTEDSYFSPMHRWRVDGLVCQFARG